MNIPLSGSKVRGVRAAPGHMRLIAAAIVVGAVVWLMSMGRHPSAQSDRSVTPEVLARALSSDVPERLTMSDDVDFFERRLQERGPEDVLALRRLVSASLLRFQTYGREADLARAEQHLATTQRDVHESFLTSFPYLASPNN